MNWYLWVVGNASDSGGVKEGQTSGCRVICKNRNPLLAIHPFSSHLSGLNFCFWVPPSCIHASSHLFCKIFIQVNINDNSLSDHIIPTENDQRSSGINAINPYCLCWPNGRSVPDWQLFIFLAQTFRLKPGQTSTVSRWPNVKI